MFLSLPSVTSAGVADAAKHPSTIMLGLENIAPGLAAEAGERLSTPFHHATARGCLSFEILKP